MDKNPPARDFPGGPVVKDLPCNTNTNMLYAYFVLHLIKLGTASSWLGFLGCSLRVNIISTPTKQGISVMSKDFIFAT